MLENNNIQAGLANVNAKAEIKTDIKGEMKVADKVVNQIGGTTNNNDYSNNAILNQNFYISVIPNINCAEGITNALKLGNENALLVGNEVQKLLSDNGITETQIQEKLSNPNILATMAEANKIAYKTNNIDKRKILADLIYQKITTDIDEESNTLSLAIKAMENLTNNHLKVIAFLYLLQSKYIRNNISYSQFCEFYSRYITKLIDFPFDKASDLGITVIANGMAVTYTFGRYVHDFLPEVFTCNSGKPHPEVSPESRGYVAHLASLWNQLGMGSAFLTPLGKCLGQKYLYNVFGIIVNDESKI